jgi:hypothetical protein
MDPDMNNYDLEHVCTAHPVMSAEAWRGVYRDAWARYYTDAHVETVLRRAVASGIKTRKIVDVMTAFSGASRIEGVHPLQCGIIRRKVRTQRRRGMAIVNPFVFYPLRGIEFVKVLAQWLGLARRYRRIMKRVVADASSLSYVDEATRVSSVEEAENADFVAVFADKIPNTHGAPKRQAAVAS